MAIVLDGVSSSWRRAATWIRRRVSASRPAVASIASNVSVVGGLWFTVLFGLLGRELMPVDPADRNRLLQLNCVSLDGGRYMQNIVKRC